MTKYRVRSGEMDIKIKTSSDDMLDPSFLALRAIVEARQKKGKSLDLGVLIEIEGGDWVGCDSKLVWTQSILEKAGMFKDQ